MRGAALLLTLAGCDLVFTIRPAPPDGAEPGGDRCDLPRGFDESLTMGTWFVADRASQHALKLGAQTVSEAFGNADTTQESAFVEIEFPNAAQFAGYDAPRLAPGGNELMVRAAEVATGRDVLLDAQRVGDVWNDLTDVQLLGTDVAAVTTGTTTSPPTTTSPRRMMVTQLGSTFDGVIEFEEVRAGVWQEHHLYVPQNYNAFFIEHAMLTPDGSQLVLLVQSTSTDTQLEVWIATRQTLLDTFNTITMLYADPTGSPDFPFLTVDCRTHLYFSIGDQIHHVIL